MPERWTLFLDRDGVINKHLRYDYVKTPGEFVFEKDVLKALEKASGVFSRIIIVTNQRGISLGKLTHEVLEQIHGKMKRDILMARGKIDGIYYCPDGEESPYRKPNTGMALQAQSDFPDINFGFSVIAGDSVHDLEFGKKLGMKTVFISQTDLPVNQQSLADRVFPDLITFMDELIRKNTGPGTFFT